jgi:hypothetical protein
VIELCENGFIEKLNGGIKKKSGTEVECVVLGKA